MDFTFKHTKSGEIKTVSLTEKQIQEMLENELFDELTCDCQPVGETNVVECGCESYFDDFALQDHMPRTMNPVPKNPPKKKADKKEPVITFELLEQQTAEYLATGGAIEPIANGIGAYVLMSGPKYYASMQACSTIGNQGRKKEHLPIARR